MITSRSGERKVIEMSSRKAALPRRTKPKPAKPGRSRAGARRAAYHHGDLRQALIAAGLALVEEGGAEAVNLREAARRVGVSPGAPFRHFESRTALLTAIAEESMGRFRAEIERALARAPAADPLQRLRALGVAYLAWAMRNPAHFEVLSTRRLFDFAGADALRRDNDAIIAATTNAFSAAYAAGQLQRGDPALARIAGRALVYGFARMLLDGQLPRWGVKDSDAEKTAIAAVDLFLAGLAGAPQG